jgi:hypothetical protein
MQEATEEWTHLRNWELHSSNCSTNIYWGGQLKKDEMQVAFSMYKRGEKYIQSFGWEI